MSSLKELVDIASAQSEHAIEYRAEPIHPEWPGRERRRFYIALHSKFAMALVAAIGWTILSVYLAQSWIDDLGALTNPTFALLTITFIAFVPGFMNTFLLASLLLDRRPVRYDISSWPGVTILVPAYNEEEVIASTLKAVAELHYDGPIEVLIVNDGSTDTTAECARTAIAALTRGGTALVESGSAPAMTMRLIDYRANRGKANALNAALIEAGHDIICTIDADSRPRPEALRQIVGRMLSDPPGTMAVAGSILVGNSDETLMTRAQEWDYFHAIAAVKRMQSMYNGTLVAQGAFSIYRKSAIQAVGGWPELVGEDIGLTWAMLDRGWRVGYAEDAIVWTNVPTTFGQFARQRKRWARGMIEALESYRHLFIQRRMTTLFIWWDMLFLPLDLIYTFIFLPGIIAALFGYYWIVGPMTLAVLPLAAIGNLVIFDIQARMLHGQGLRVHRDRVGFLTYVFGYSMIMQPICVWGYAAELFGRRKSWETK